MIIFITCLVSFIKRMSEKVPSVQDVVYRCLDFYNQQSKTQRYSVYDDIKQRKAAKPHTGEAEARE